MQLAAFALGALTAFLCVWGGFYLARLERDDTPALTPSLPESYDGAVLDAAIYEPAPPPHIIESPWDEE